jgi:hypothetical protein
LNPSVTGNGTASVIYRDENGIPLATDAINLAPGASQLAQLTSLYGTLVNRRGLIDVRLSGLEMFGLRNSARGALTFLPVLPR